MKLIIALFVVESWIINMKEIAKILFGSQNMGLDGPTSDRDYKVIYTPSFEDLYFRREADQHSLKGYDKDHYAPIDIRKFHKLALEGNVNIVEMLFSIDIQSSLPEFNDYLNKVKELYNRGYIAYVWDKFYSSLQGLVMNSLDRYGPTRKVIARAHAYIRLSQTIAIDSFCVNETSWRDNPWNKTAREMRFDETVWAPSAEQIKETLNYLKILLGEAAQSNQNPISLKLFEEEKIKLQNCIYNIVKINMEEPYV